MRFTPETLQLLLRLASSHLISLPEVSSKIYRNLSILLSQKLRHTNELLTLD